MHSLRDINAIQQHEHDEKNDAKRVIIIGSEMPEIKFPEHLKIDNNIDIYGITGPILDKMNETKCEISYGFSQLYNSLQKDKNSYPADIKVIEVPIISKEIEIKEIEKQVIVKEIEFKILEKPVIIKEKELEKFPTFLKVCIAVQSFGVLGLLIIKLFK